MNYTKVRDALSKANYCAEKMRCTKFGRFTVCENKNGDAIIVDPETAEIIKHFGWCLDTTGYPVSNFCGKVARLHEVVMALNYEERPEGCYVDHINQDKMDNRLINLRFVTPQESSRNMPLKSDNKSGATGVCKRKNGGYRAYITANKKRIDLGTYANIKDAISARREAESVYGFKTRPATIREECIGGGCNDDG